MMRLWKMSNRNSVSITLVFYWYAIFFGVFRDKPHHSLFGTFWDRLKMIKTTQIKRVVV